MVDVIFKGWRQVLEQTALVIVSTYTMNTKTINSMRRQTVVLFDFF